MAQPVMDETPRLRQRKLEYFLLHLVWPTCNACGAGYRGDVGAGRAHLDHGDGLLRPHLAQAARVLPLIP